MRLESQLFEVHAEELYESRNILGAAGIQVKKIVLRAFTISSEMGSSSGERGVCGAKIYIFYREEETIANFCQKIEDPQAEKPCKRANCQETDTDTDTTLTPRRSFPRLPAYLMRLPASSPIAEDSRFEWSDSASRCADGSMLTYRYNLDCMWAGTCFAAAAAATYADATARIFTAATHAKLLCFLPSPLRGRRTVSNCAAANDNHNGLGLRYLRHYEPRSRGRHFSFKPASPLLSRHQHHEEPRARARQSTLKKEVGSFLCLSVPFIQIPETISFASV